MKALIISDDNTFVAPIDKFLKCHQLDTIIYKWFIKALDNIEEIKPDLIILSASEFPRHWKTLVQFVKSGIGGNSIKVFLYEPSAPAVEENKKAEELGVVYFTSLDELELNKITDSYNVQGNILFNHPETSCIYSAKLINKDNKRIQFIPDFKIPDLSINDFINRFTLYKNEHCEAYKGKVIAFENNIVTLEYQVE